MKIRLFSDLHLEFGGFTIPRLDSDPETILVLAGDISVGKRKSTYLDFLADATTQFRKIVYVPGNHEYYGGSFANTWDKMKNGMATQLNDSEFGRYLHMVNNEVVVVDDFAFVCATLWTDFSNQNPHAMMLAQSYMNDYAVIRRGNAKDPYAGKLTPMDTLKAHSESKVFIFESIRQHKADGKTVVVVTHHAPSYQSTGPGFEGDPLNPAYMTEFGYHLLELDDEGLAPELWVHGHVHNSFDYMIGSTRIRTNPRGYVKYDNGFPENQGFDPELVIEL